MYTDVWDPVYNVVWVGNPAILTQWENENGRGSLSGSIFSGRLCSPIGLGFQDCTRIARGLWIVLLLCLDYGWVLPVDSSSDRCQLRWCEKEWWGSLPLRTECNHRIPHRSGHKTGPGRLLVLYSPAVRVLPLRDDFRKIVGFPKLCNPISSSIILTLNLPPQLRWDCMRVYGLH